MKHTFDFYDKTNLKSYNLNKSMQEQLNLLDKLDVFTKKHCENVASLTCRICEYLHCSKGFIEYCTMCAYLHDIGKISIPSEILQKPGKLTPKEYEIMKSHTILGYQICMKDPKLKPYIAGAYYHHEALNGSGYPQGLTKKEIPYEAQIIRVADEYDAIVSKRQYKSHIGISDTLRILIENSKEPNLKNNPKIVKALFKVVIDDIEYEIYSVQTYVDELLSEIKRLEQILKYKEKMETAKTQKDKDYYLEGMKMLLKNKETLENFLSVYDDYKAAYTTRKAIVDNLYQEIKVIKKLKI